MIEPIFALLLIFLLIATLQDLKRTELDVWLDLLILVSGTVYIAITSILQNTEHQIIQLGFLLFIMAVVSVLFNKARLFAGGDSMLLFSITPFFIAMTLSQSLLNIGKFLILLFIAGAIYGMIYCLMIFSKNYKKTKGEMKNIWKKNKLNRIFILGIISTPLYFLNPLFITLSILIIIFPLLFAFSKAIENKIMTVKISPKNLQVGDWITEKIKLKSKTINPSFDGLTKEEIKLLIKANKKVEIKRGIAFGPVFLFAAIIYILL